jgi:hypothetical protein
MHRRAFGFSSLSARWRRARLSGGQGLVKGIAAGVGSQQNRVEILEHCKVRAVGAVDQQRFAMRAADSEIPLISLIAPK